jgi:alkanesulfonate monooxygenase SsuD/methylene tetrahydromethanopterin reductase-like flavin-dependent oxidoreductase (luciferase family)
LHDTTRLENLGIPAVPVATTEFMTAARAQASALGRADFDAVYVAHPIQDQTPQEIAARAEAVIDEIVARFVSQKTR